MSTMTGHLTSYWVLHMKHNWNQAEYLRSRHSHEDNDLILEGDLHWKPEKIPFIGRVCHLFWETRCMTQWVTHSDRYYMRRSSGTSFLFLSFNWTTFERQLIHTAFKVENTPAGCHLSSAAWNLLCHSVQPETCNTDYPSWQTQIMHRLAAVREHWWIRGDVLFSFRNHEQPHNHA